MKYESFNPCNPRHLELLKEHKFYTSPGTGITIIDETNCPDSSKREDSFKVVAEFVVTKELLDRGPQPPKLPSFKEMRYSEHDGNAVREVQ